MTTTDPLADAAAPELATGQVLARMKSAYGAASLAQLAELMGEKRSTVGNWSARGSIPLDALLKCHHATGASYDWLITGCDGSQFVIDGGHPGQKQAIASDWSRAHEELAIASSVSAQEPSPAYLARSGAIRLPAPDGREFIALPLVGAGWRAEPAPVAFEAAWLQRVLGSPDDRLAAVIVDGDDMTPTFPEGDLVVIDITQKTVRTSGVFAMQTRGGIAVKRIRRLNEGGLQLLSDNAAYQPETTTADSVNILGRVVWPRSR